MASRNGDPLIPEDNKCPYLLPGVMLGDGADNADDADDADDVDAMRLGDIVDVPPPTATTAAC